ncbi:MAG: hypothetical protein AB8B89_05335 [Gammaproteobacteria bacterium]
MKSSEFAHLFIFAAITCSMLIASANAEDASVDQNPPSAEEISNAQPEYSIKTETVYESSFLPGVRLCNEEEVDYRGDFRKVNCQDERLINSVSTRKQDPYNTRPNIIVDDRIKPNGNIFRINFRKKESVVSNTSDN